MERTQATPHGQTSPQATPRTAVVWQVLTSELERYRPQAANVVDVGGGTGGFAVPLAELGHWVTVVDPSPDALATLTRRSADAGVSDRVTAVQGDGDHLAELVEADSVDLVLCHSLLEVIDDPRQVLQAVADSLRPGGAASVLVANQAAAVLSRALGGHLDAAAELFGDGLAQASVADTLRRRFDVPTVTALLEQAGLSAEALHGVRVVSDLVPASVADTAPARLLELELRLSEASPYRDIAAQLHLLARQPAS